MTTHGCWICMRTLSSDIVKLIFDGSRPSLSISSTTVSGHGLSMSAAMSLSCLPSYFAFSGLRKSATM